MKKTEGAKHNRPELKSFRKKLRSELTPAEAKLWDYLKAKQVADRKFRRQHSVGPYVLDFYCPSEHLAVELDGQAHASVSAHHHDTQRDKFLTKAGIRVLRFENKLVFQRPEVVIKEIQNHFGWSEQCSPDCQPLCQSAPPPALRPPREKQPPLPSGTPLGRRGVLE